MDSIAIQASLENLAGAYQRFFKKQNEAPRSILVAGFFTTISMLYIVEVTLRTKRPLQLSGLAQKYIGKIGSWFMFAAVFVNSLGTLTAYTTGSGEVLASMLGMPEIVGSLLFFIPAVIVVWLGLKALGAAEKYITAIMVIMVLILILATIIGPGIQAEYLSYTNLGYAIPVFSLVIFTFIAQYTVPELSRGFLKGNVKQLPRAIVVGTGITGILVILVPMSYGYDWLCRYSIHYWLVRRCRYGDFTHHDVGAGPKKYGDREPEWTAGWIAHPVIQSMIVILFVGAGCYTLLDIFSILPSGW